ncbi:hypothetical protein EDD85DRAFT_972057 [Armillaria nabsnona]|nr:hypothetical protein EDD85DRAFT_972057 [Armillaria nabsnona]
MVDPAWLVKEENIKYDVPSRIAESGKLWGDEEDPEDLEVKAKKVKQEKQDIKKKMRLDEDGNGKVTATGSKKDKRLRKAAPVSTAVLARISGADGDWSD